LSNVLSTVFSKNINVSVWGSYDRWEGIITTSLYLFCTFLIANKKGFSNNKKIIWAIIIASSLSCLYGIVQSLGIDIVKWSLDPSRRVFGSINNPVHYCAILGMSLPLIVGQLFYTIKKNNNPKPKLSQFGAITIYYVVVGVLTQLIPMQNQTISWILFYIALLGSPFIYYGIKAKKAPSIQNQLNILFNAILLITYATYLSYSRATWVGLTAALGLIFTITLIIEKQKPKNEFLISIIGCVLMTTFSYLFLLFKLNTISPVTQLLAAISIIASYLVMIFPEKKNQWLNFCIGLTIIFSQFFIGTWLSIIVGSITFLSLIKMKQERNLLPVKLLTFIILLMNIQFVSGSLLNFLFVIILIIGLFILEESTTKQTPFSNNQIFQWKILTIGIIIFVIISPTLFLKIQSQINKGQASSNQLILQASAKINSYSNIAIEGSARTSMWKSSFPWIKDHPILGTGLDTIKFYYPKYRRPEYGKLEGGHNFTPDRLHNEYLNTLASKGIFGFVVYYLLFIGGTTFSLLIFTNKTSDEAQYLIIGLIGSSFVYLGQIMFNFGVVATLVYFYFFIGLAMSLKNNHEAT
ncbi:MAG: O-antigen ligase family protein, partial [Candidatus Margulisiibacteriota bacterium]